MPSLMHGPNTAPVQSRACACIKNVSRLAKTVMGKNNHVMIVGDGARRFAVAEGFEEMNLLTEHSRKIWLAGRPSPPSIGGPGIDSAEWKEHLSAIFDHDEKKDRLRENVIAPSANRHDSVHGCGCQRRSFRDDDDFRDCRGKFPAASEIRRSSGRAAAWTTKSGRRAPTGKGEENIKISGGHTIIEMMRQGKTPTEALPGSAGAHRAALQKR